MGSDAELVVLCIGLALRDVEAVQFQEGDYPEEFPHWVQGSQFTLSDAEGLTTIWAKQLPEEPEEPRGLSQSDEEQDDLDIKGKGREKDPSRHGKRKAKSSDNDARADERVPR
jgi:hypothetical protein